MRLRNTRRKIDLVALLKRFRGCCVPTGGRIASVGIICHVSAEVKVGSLVGNNDR